MRSGLLLAVVSTFAFAGPAEAAKTIDRAGLIAAPIEIRNGGAAPILCQAEIAHWFATDLARIEPGRAAGLGLRFDTATGSWAATNARGEALPVERVWCGVEGRAYETRWDIGLQRERPQDRAFDCKTLGERLLCR